MKRRDFIKTSAAIAASLGLPAGAIAAVTRLPAANGLPIHQAALATETAGVESSPAETVTRLRVGLHHSSGLRDVNRIAREAGYPQPQPDLPDDENNYWADAIRRGNSYLYRVGETVIPISEHEYNLVIKNPNLYYFSSALKLHYRVNRVRDEVPESV